MDLGAGAGLQSNVFVHRLYVDLNYRWLGLSVGIKERWSDKNRYLSSGALTWSGNSRPIPEEAIKDRIAKTGKKPKAIIPVALYGMPYKIDRIMAIADKYDI